MTSLTRRALLRLPMSEGEVLDFYEKSTRETALGRLTTLCESHERLRAENQGLEVLLGDANEANDKLKAELQEARMDAGGERVEHLEDVGKLNADLAALRARVAELEAEAGRIRAERDALVESHLRRQPPHLARPRGCRVVEAVRVPRRGGRRRARRLVLHARPRRPGGGPRAVSPRRTSILHAIAFGVVVGSIFAAAVAVPTLLVGVPAGMVARVAGWSGIVIGILGALYEWGDVGRDG